MVIVPLIIFYILGLADIFLFCCCWIIIFEEDIRLRKMYRLPELAIVDYCLHRPERR